MLELSQDASNYYYAMGSESALTAEMQTRRVGGEGRWHVFHLPEGPSMLQVPSSGSRRNSFSALVQLRNGQVLPKVFPEYGTSSSYEYPGSAEAQLKERDAAELITAPLFKDYLSKVTSLESDGVDTRSSSNLAASNNTISFLQQQFKGMGLSTCLQKFGANGANYANVVAYLQGSTRDTLTLGAHYDSRPFTGSAPGANDNGSGVAALLSLAKVLTGMKMRPKRDVFFVGFAAEEPGLLGSEAYVPALEGRGSSQIPSACQPPGSFLQRRAKEVHHSAIILDEVGWKSPNFPGKAPTIQLEAASPTSDLMNHMAQANKLYNGAEVVATHSDHPFGSDHMPFIQQKIEAVLVINGDDERYPAYHQSADTMANVDEEYASKLTKMVLGGVVRTAGWQV